MTGRLLLAVAGVAVVAACASPEQKVERYTKSGYEFLEEGNNGKANIQFRSALKINEDHVPALLGLYEIYERKNEFRRMFAMLQRISRVDPTNTRARIDLAKLHLLSGDETTALERIDEALAIDPEDAEAIGVKAAIMFRSSNRDEALALARRALAIKPAVEEAVSVIVTDHIQNEEYEPALAELDAAIAVNPKASVLHLLKVQIFNKQGRAGDVAAAYARLIDEFPEESGYRRLYVLELYKTERYAEAREQLMVVTELLPDEMDGYMDVVRLDYKVDGEAKARETFQSFIDAQPENAEMKFAYASFLRQLGADEGARGVYSSLRKDDEDAVVLEALNEIAAMDLKADDRASAEAIIAEILTRDERNSGALLKQSSLKIVDGDLEAAINDLRLVLADAPESSQARLLMAAAFEKSGQIEAAEGQYAEAFDNAASKPQIGNAFARFLVRNGKIDRAETVLTEALSVNGSHEDNLKLLAAVRLQRQDWRGAEEVAEILGEIEEDDVVVNRILGVAYSGLKDYAGAIEALSNANDNRPLASRPLATLISAYVEADRHDEAETLLRSNIENDPAAYDSRMLLARVLTDRSRDAEAKSVLRDAIDAAPTEVAAYELLFRMYVAEGRLQDAETLIDQGLVRAPDSDGLNMMKADLLIGVGRAAEALPIYEQVLARRPDDLIAANNYASILSDQKDDPASLEKAVAVAAVLRDAGNPSFLDTYGWALVQAGRVEEGVAVLEDAVSRAPKFAEIRYHLGAAQAKLGEKDAAAQSLRQAIEDSGGAESDVAKKATALLNAL
ncbi:MAG: tetratricopeptide repeat protein [Pseudomonadota bacterium]